MKDNPQVAWKEIAGTLSFSSIESLGAKQISISNIMDQYWESILEQITPILQAWFGYHSSHGKIIKRKDAFICTKCRMRHKQRRKKQP